MSIGSDSAAVDVPSSSSRPGSAQQQPSHHLPASLNMGPAHRSAKGPLGMPLMSSGPSQVDIMSRFEDSSAATVGRLSPLRLRSESPPRSSPTQQQQQQPVRPLQEFVARIEEKIRRRAQVAKDSALVGQAKRQPLAPRRATPQLRTATPTADAAAPTSSTMVQVPSDADIRLNVSSRPSSRGVRVPSRTSSAMQQQRPRAVTPLSVMSMDLMPPPPLWDDVAADMRWRGHHPTGSTVVSHGGRPPTPSHRPPTVTSSTTSIHQWIDSRQSILAGAATAISPVTSSKHSAAPRTLANSAIRWRGIRAASALARAFEVARTPEELLMDGNIRLPQKLM